MLLLLRLTADLGTELLAAPRVVAENSRTIPMTHPLYETGPSPRRFLDPWHSRNVPVTCTIACLFPSLCWALPGSLRPDTHVLHAWKMVVSYPVTMACPQFCFVFFLSGICVRWASIPTGPLRELFPAIVHLSVFLSFCPGGCLTFVFWALH